MRGVPRWFAVLCVVAFGAVVCAFSLRRAFAPASLRSQAALSADEVSIKGAVPPDFADSFGDGTPDFLRLHDATDRAAFRGWFTLLAESQYFRGTKLPREIDDCAGLLRFSYREALRRHDSVWLSAMSLPVPSGSGEVRQYTYPHTRVGAAMFRVQDGSFAVSDLSDGAFAEFADAKTLWRDNTYSVGRDFGPRSSRRPALLSPVRGPDHVSRDDLRRPKPIQPGSEQYLVYHTGPQGKDDPGEIRRLTVSELMNFPDARWRPVASNPAFLGVYRWNILRGDQ